MIFFRYLKVDDRLFLYVALRENIRENKVYIIIAILVIFIIIFTIIISTPAIVPAYIEDKYIKINGWKEEILERRESTGLFGLEKSKSYTYSNNNETYPAFITVTTFKTLFTMSEEELLEKTEQTILDSSSQGIQLDMDSKEVGERANRDFHNTRFLVYSGNDTSKIPVEKILIIGETWNCPDSGTSIICIGLAQITDNLHNNFNDTTDFFSKIVGDSGGTIQNYYDENGLLYYTKCH